MKLFVRYFQILCFVLLIILAITLVVSKSVHHYNRYQTKLTIENVNSITINFEGFNNETGSKEFIIPNIIHFIRFNISEFNFIDYVTLKAAMRNHRPDMFFFHTNDPDIPWTGKYWDWVCKDQELFSRIKTLHLDLPHEVFGQPLREEWRLYHGSDLGRIYVLMKYGGIYLDNDVYVVQSLNKYRHFEFVLNWDEGSFLGNQVFMAHKDARFLRRYLDTYKKYLAKSWYYNAGEGPTREVLHIHPELIHRVKGKLGVGTGISTELYSNPKLEWRKFDVLHLLIDHRSYMDKNFNQIPEFDEVNIQNYKYPFGEMAREIINNT